MTKVRKRMRRLTKYLYPLQYTLIWLLFGCATMQGIFERNARYTINLKPLNAIHPRKQATYFVALLTLHNDWGSIPDDLNFNSLSSETNNSGNILEDKIQYTFWRKTVMNFFISGPTAFARPIFQLSNVDEKCGQLRVVFFPKTDGPIGFLFYDTAKKKYFRPKHATDTFMGIGHADARKREMDINITLGQDISNLCTLELVEQESLKNI